MNMEKINNISMLYNYCNIKYCILLDLALFYFVITIISKTTSENNNTLLNNIGLYTN